MPGKSLTTAEFIKKAKEAHKDDCDNYDYSKTVYKNKRTKVTIICKKHGQFEQLPSNHYKSGCPKCGSEAQANKINFTQEQFIEKSLKNHKVKYDYTNTVYKSMRDSVDIICPDHGLFTQNAGDHSRGYGCPYCSNNVPLTQEEVIERSKKIHKNKYTYEKFKFKTVNKEALITCSIHGEFLQKVQNHLLGNGCPKCAGQNKTTEELIKQFRSIHKDKYDYSEVKYVKSCEKIKIICKTHGIFYQAPDKHLQGCGCPKCKGYYKTTDDYIKEASVIHNNKYDYSKVKYINAQAKIMIICKQHGEFNQKASSQLYGCGCPLCAKVGYSIGQIEWLTYLSLLHKKNIQHFNNGGEFIINGKPVDGYCKETNEVFEYHGNLFHGCPRTYPPNMLNPVNKKPMKQLYKETLQKEKMIKDAGYKLITIWEDQWQKMKKQLVTIQRFLKNRTKPKDLKKVDFKKSLVPNLEKKKCKPTCPHCKITFSRPSSRNKHVKNQVCTKKIEFKKYSCPMCKKICRDKYDYERHIGRKRPCKPSADVDYTTKNVEEKPKIVKIKIKKE